jgi:hypothetical protein
MRFFQEFPLKNLQTCLLALLLATLSCKEKNALRGDGNIKDSKKGGTDNSTPIADDLTPNTPLPTSSSSPAPDEKPTVAPKTCRPQGVAFGRACWYKSEHKVSCTSTCAIDNRGGYNIKTLTHAGSSGSDAACTEIVRAFGFTQAVNGYSYGGGVHPNLGAGCFFKSDVNFLYRVTYPPTIPDSGFYTRFCACGEDL